jgi:hypothetical protein
VQDESFNQEENSQTNIEETLIPLEKSNEKEARSRDNQKKGSSSNGAKKPSVKLNPEDIQDFLLDGP